jgi:hypothetical protein
MIPVQRVQLIERYASGLNDACKAIERLAPAELDAAAEGEWCARQIAHHLADTELFRSTRLRLLLAEDDPFIPSFDEAHFARVLHYERPIEASLALVRATLATNLALLERIGEEEWLRSGRHQEFGAFSIEDWLERAANHGPEHLAQLGGLRS